MSFEELFETLRIRRRLSHLNLFKPETQKHYPNVPVTLLPQWCKGSTEDGCWVNPQNRKPRKRDRFRKWIAKWYSKLWVTDEYRTSGVKISDAIKPPPVSISIFKFDQPWNWASTHSSTASMSSVYDEENVHDAMMQTMNFKLA